MITTLTFPILNAGKSVHRCINPLKHFAEAMSAVENRLLEEALKKEDAARHDLPEQIEERLDAKDKVMTGSPVSTASEGGEICPCHNEPKSWTLPIRYYLYGQLYEVRHLFDEHQHSTGGTNLRKDEEEAETNQETK